MTAEFTGVVRRWHEDKPGGLAVIDIPADLIATLGGRLSIAPMQTPKT